MFTWATRSNYSDHVTTWLSFIHRTPTVRHTPLTSQHDSN